MTKHINIIVSLYIFMDLFCFLVVHILMKERLERVFVN